MSGRKIIEGLNEAVAHARGDESAARLIVPTPDLAATVKAAEIDFNATARELAEQIFGGGPAVLHHTKAEAAPAITAALRAAYEQGRAASEADHATALRRAKAEGAREAAKVAKESAEEWRNDHLLYGLLLSVRDAILARADKIEGEA
ncbi:MAG: hypothetical protein JO107_16300 [Hyphomicrobiales bacterium]|nr:hypothetical protein [Hyphomicrobiales bacterium]